MSEIGLLGLRTVAYMCLALPLVMSWMSGDFTGILYEIRHVSAGYTPPPIGHRVLIPILVHWLSSGLRLPIVDLLIGMNFLFLVAGFFATWGLVRETVSDSVAELAPFFSFLVLLSLLNPSRVSHKYAAFAVTAAGLWAIRRERWKTVALLFAVGMLIRETSLLLLVAFVAARWGHDRLHRLVWIAFVGVAYFVALKIALQFAVTPASHVIAADEHHGAGFAILTLARNVDIIAATFLAGGVAGWSWITVRTVFVGFCVWDWKDKPVYLRRFAWHAIALVVLMMLFAMIEERRVFIEVAPWLGAMAAVSVAQIGRRFGPSIAAGETARTSA